MLHFIRLTLLVLGMVVLPHAVNAQLDYHVVLDTNTLTGTYYADFSLSDGSIVIPGIPDTNNQVIIDAFDLGGGTTGAALAPIGISSGNMTGNIMLEDGDPGGVADWTQSFAPGTRLAFDVHMSTYVDVGGVPDSFLFRLLDSQQNTVITSDWSGLNGFVHADLNSATLSLNDVQTYFSTAPRLGPPAITAVPEPGMPGLLASMLVIGCLLSRQRRH